ncbi:MAG: hypothetical protein OZ913_01480 [Ignavibacteriaceae bacterium]|jgi:hypothetical protein|nr:MAG: hypothetical protein EDM69_07990 [Chlorobiota bacterium]KXK04581.1 MAG: Beta-propeller repeat protein [Chlorobi bacterium OLB4]MBV6399403.1 hypothetical protein [Ignavibacteria bacterium]MCC6886600.1 hypothetical protein [Ignavibacteriales bacterium]MCE7953262.1 hypothetical protein [Chlorobi bacterium CHB7]MDL1887955.1 hypothetical protein [Ignavibacteria bacterium CHB1]MEB2328956.1 hypothetical protein [Ignavibacteriaceae bacterium]OQY76491.1 MAG: hypothetical protein B6D43_09950 [
MKNLLTILFVLSQLTLLVPENVVSQSVEQEWVVRTQHQYDTYPSKIELDGEGNVIIVGYERIPDGTRFLILKYSSNDNLIWKRYMNDSPNVYGYTRDLSLDDSNNIYVLGNTSTALP